MMKWRIGFVFFLMFGAIAHAQEGWHSPHSARHLVGERATICGIVGSTRYARETRGTPTYINLGPAFPNHVFTIVVWGEDRYKFPYAPETLEGAVCVRGTVGTYRNIPQIVATSPEQISHEN